MNCEFSLSIFPTMVSVQTILNELQSAVNFSELCRLCGKMKSPAISVFDESYRISYHDIINFHFKEIQVSKTDVLPLKLCDDCAKFMVLWHRFHNTCLQVNKALLSVVNQLQTKFVGVESNTSVNTNDIEVIEVDDECVGSISPRKSPETSVECVPGSYVFVDTNAPPNEQKTAIVPDKPSATPLSANGGFGGTTKCMKCGSVFLKSKVEKVENRGTCYACFAKIKKRTTTSISPIFENYLVTDENKQRYFICDLCNFSCDALPDVFDHHYKTEHPQADLDQNFFKVKNDSLSRFTHEKNGVRAYRCDRCQLSCISRNLFVKHYAEHGDVTLLAKSSMIQFKENKFCCLACPKIFAHFGAARRHLNRVHAEKRFKCNMCQKAFTHAHKAQEHEKRHLKIKFFMCDICGKRFVEKANMEKHLKDNLCSKYTCAQCDQNFSDKASLKNHILHWENFKEPAIADCRSVQQIQNSVLKKVALLKYECAKCGKKFKSKGALRIHIVEEFNLKPYKCFVCEQTFTTTVLLRKHLNSCNKSILDTKQFDSSSSTDKGDNSFGCKLCGRTFRKIGYLRQHFRLHSTNASSKPYVCQYCGKSYTMKASFESHLSTEMNLRKFACSVCGKRYNSSSHLTAHIKKHHRLREFKCNTCDKEFAYERDLKEHEKTHDEVKEYFCDKCGGFFKTGRYLKVHWERCYVSKM